MSHMSFLKALGNIGSLSLISFSDSNLVLVLANPQHIKNVPGRKTDMKDAEWIAQLGRCGLIEPSYIPAPEVVQLRLLTRRLRSYKQRQTQVKNEIHNLLQRAKHF